MAEHHREPGVIPERPFDRQRFEDAVDALLDAAGFSTENDHLHKTRRRVADLWEHRLLGGYGADLAEILGGGFEDERQDIVIMRGVAVHGVCPHHLVPFRGVAHIAYAPGGRLHGFGRIARLVDAISQRLTYQEWMTRSIADALVEHGAARGAACVVEAEQLCLLLGENRRGEERVRTQAFAGCFADDEGLRREFLDAVASPRVI
jgi:GTP cyclohydrolase I